MTVRGESFYGAALAHAHADGYAAHWDGAADWLASLARETNAEAFVFDIGCGDGRLLDALRSRGVDGAGLDVSPAFVAAARARGLAVEQGDAARPVLPQASFIVALGEVLVYENAAERSHSSPPVARHSTPSRRAAVSSSTSSGRTFPHRRLA